MILIYYGEEINGKRRHIPFVRAFVKPQRGGLYLLPNLDAGRLAKSFLFCAENAADRLGIPPRSNNIPERYFTHLDRNCARLRFPNYYFKSEL